jgi:hypothetical protein
MVSYDLKDPGRNCQALWDALRQYGAVRLLESVWYVSGNYNCQQLREQFWHHMEADDRLLVVRFDPWAGNNLMKLIV